ncbi:CP2 transcription factor-domain-containing protein [Peziza echinospora]|nr:CP2 transcription factor-domain-containing protein [Peziza echinospora]
MSRQALHVLVLCHVPTIPALALRYLPTVPLPDPIPQVSLDHPSSATLLAIKQSSQRPPDELYERFKKSFPDVRSTTGDSEAGSTVTAGNLQESTLAQPRSDSLGSNWPTHNYLTFARFNNEDLDPTPRAAGEPFRFTPSLLDPNSSAFADFANQPPAYYTPTSGVSNHTLNNHMNELPTPNGGIGIGAALSMGNGITLPPQTSSDLSYAPQTLHPHQFHNYLPFSQPLHPQYVEPAFDGPHSSAGSPMDMGPDMDMQHMVPMYGKQYEHEHAPLSAENFRYHVTLNAPTAMIKHHDEIPVTYLNKGQAYSVSIADTAPLSPSSHPIRYRTFIRISFHDENQRAKPAQCWQLWKEGRGTNEAHQRGGKLQAVEFVETSSSAEDERKRGKVELEFASFDGFSVIWSPAPGGSADTSISVRFNFLSTDFSHSKGVKGIPVRLCAKTEVYNSGSPRSTSIEKAEICFCKVKLFRDHGAERKLANDVLHVKKTIEKLRQQLQQTEGTGMKLFGKKKRDEELMKGSKPGKAAKHKRTWSMSSASSVNGCGKSAEEETNEKLSAMQDMFSSTRPVSVLYLRGGDLDDPDLNPVQLAGEMQDLTEEVWVRRRSSVATTISSFVSPSPSSASVSQQGDSYPPDRREWTDGGYHTVPGSLVSPDLPVKIKLQTDTGMLTGWIEAIGIDSNYRAPSDQPIQATMCIYILPMMPDSQTTEQYYRAVYLPSRSQSSITAGIAAKCGIDPATVVRTSYLNAQNLSVVVDDDFVQQMNEGQDMKVQVLEVEENETRGFELKLIY